jgi:hypothetical protein
LIKKYQSMFYSQERKQKITPIKHIYACKIL